MLRIVLAATLAAASSTALAMKCTSGKKTLYTDAPNCPAGYSYNASAETGTVSTIGKSENVRQQEREFLNSRAQENNQYNAQVTQQQVQATQQGAIKAGLCASLSDQARSLEASMRQPNSPQWLDYLKQQHRGVRDEMYRNKC